MEWAISKLKKSKELSGVSCVVLEEVKRLDGPSIRFVDLWLPIIR